MVPYRRYNHLLHNQLIACDIPQRRGNRQPATGNWRNGIDGKTLRSGGGSIANVCCLGDRFTALASVTYRRGGRRIISLNTHMTVNGSPAG